MLSADEITLLVILLATLLLIAFSKIPTEIIALMSLLALNFSGIITVQQALSGFSSPVVITLLGLFVITQALESAGLIQWVAVKLNDLGGESEVRLIILFMATGAVLSLVMNNVAAGAVLLPAAVRVAQISEVRVSKLLIPMSFGTLVGGMATYLTTANIVMSGLLLERGMDGLGMLDFIPTGGLIVLAALLYMVFVGRHLLPERATIAETVSQTDLQETYQLDDRMWEVKVLPKSQLANQMLGKSGIGKSLGLTVLAVWHKRQAIYLPAPEQKIYVGDHLLVVGREARIESLLKWGTALVSNNANKPKLNARLDMAEAIVPPRSQVIGQTLTQLKFRDRWQLSAIALWRGGDSYRTDVGKMPLQVGDALLLVGQPEHIQNLSSDSGFLIPQIGYPLHPLRVGRALGALLITTIVLSLAILELLPLALVMLAGAVAMVVLGCLELREFYNAIEWKVIFLVAGMLPLSIAMSETGLARRVGAALVEALAAYDPHFLVAGMFLLTVLITQVIGGQVSALLVGPIAINSALQMGVNPQAMAVTVAIGCSTAFLTPLAHPVNILMMGPGGYSFGDFLKVGLGMTLITLITLLLGMELFWTLS